MNITNKLSKSLKIFLVCIATFGVASCGSLPTNWAFVDKSEVNTLLKSPDTIEFEGKTYKLSIAYNAAIRNSPRGGPFVYSKEIKKAYIDFSLDEKNGYSDYTIALTKKLKAVDFWIIKKNYQYYFETYNFMLSDKGSYSLDPPFNYYPTIRNTGKLTDVDTVIVKFISISNNQTYFIKTIIN